MMDGGGEKHSIADGDTDLSFEQLTFGGDNHNDNHNDNNNNNNNSPNDKNNAKQTPNKPKKDKFRKKSNKKETPHTPEGEKNSSVYISTQEGDKIDVQALLRKLEQFGAVRGYYFKEKQNFGIVQFVDHSVVDAVIENFNTADLGFNVTVERTSRSKDLHASPHSFGSIPPHTSSPTPTPITPSTPPPPEKPDTILVLKNLPFTLKQDQLHEILLSLSTTIPQSISLHYDAVGVFRGMAFIKYRQLEDAIQVYELLNGMDVGGRKVRVEYKRKAANKPIEIPPEWQEDEELRKLWEQLSQFKDDAAQTEWYYPANLTINQRRNIYNMSEKLKLFQGTSGEHEVKALFLTKKQPQSQPHNNGSDNQQQYSGSADSKRGIDIKGARRPRRDSDSSRPGGAISPSSHSGERDFRTGGRNSVGRSDGSANKHSTPTTSSAPADVNLDWRHSQSPNQSSQHLQHSPQQHQQQPQQQQQQQQQPPPFFAPVRQPKGPDGSKGFGDQYRTARKLNLTTTCAFLATVPTTEVAV